MPGIHCSNAIRHNQFARFWRSYKSWFHPSKLRAHTISVSKWVGRSVVRETLTLDDDCDFSQQGENA